MCIFGNHGLRGMDWIQLEQKWIVLTMWKHFFFTAIAKIIVVEFCFTIIISVCRMLCYLPLSELPHKLRGFEIL